MNREKMLNLLSVLPYTLIWPGNWDDVLGTERELWINDLGYGYIMCDEPTAHWEGSVLDKESWLPLKEKIENHTIQYIDIKGTPLEKLLEELLCDDYCKESDQNLLVILKGLLKLKNGPCGTFYALSTFDIEPLFFDSETEFKSNFEKDYADEYWEDMDDTMLEEWINRLSSEDNPKLKKWSVDNNIK